MMGSHGTWCLWLTPSATPLVGIVSPPIGWPPPIDNRTRNQPRWDHAAGGTGRSRSSTPFQCHPAPLMAITIRDGLLPADPV